MNRLKNLFMLVPVAFCTGFTSPHKLINRNPHSSGILLVYTGNISFMQVGIHVEIDSSVGVRYEVVIENGSAVMSHMVLLYKFADPQKSVLYNYLTHKSKVLHCCGAADKQSNVNVVGTDTKNSYACTHLQSANYGPNGGEDYWVSPSLPGYSTLRHVLAGIGPGYDQMLIEGNILQWGGLVKMTGQTSNGMNVDINIFEANPDISFPSQDFEVPSH